MLQPGEVDVADGPGILRLAAESEESLRKRAEDDRVARDGSVEELSSFHDLE